MLKQVGTTQVQVLVADPTQTATTVTLYLTLPHLGGIRKLVCALPTGTRAGATASFVVNDHTPLSAPAIADSYVRDGTYANTNYGTVDEATVKADGTGYARQAYFKFNLADMNSQCSSAVLRLSIKSANTNVSAARWQLQYVPTDTWSETGSTGITWNNKPTSTTILSTMPGQASGYVEWDVKSLVTQEINAGNKTLSLKVIGTVVDSQSDAIFYSREDPNAGVRPQLMIDYLPLARPAVLNTTETAKEKVFGQAYPNPFNNQLTLVTNEADTSLRVYNAMGQLVIQVALAAQKMVELNTETWKSGLYYVELYNSGSVTSKKAVIKNE